MSLYPKAFHSVGCFAADKKAVTYQNYSTNLGLKTFFGAPTPSNWNYDMSSTKVIFNGNPNPTYAEILDKTEKSKHLESILKGVFTKTIPNEINSEDFNDIVYTENIDAENVEDIELQPISRKDESFADIEELNKKLIETKTQLKQNLSKISEEAEAKKAGIPAEKKEKKEEELEEEKESEKIDKERMVLHYIRKRNNSNSSSKPTLYMARYIVDVAGKGNSVVDEYLQNNFIEIEGTIVDSHDKKIYPAYTAKLNRLRKVNKFLL